MEHGVRRSTLAVAGTRVDDDCFATLCTIQLCTLRASVSPSCETFSRPIHGSTNATLSNLAGGQLGTDADGSFFLDAPSSPTGGGNQIQLVSGAASVFARDTINEWGVRPFNSLAIKRTPSFAATSSVAFDGTNLARSLGNTSLELRGGVTTKWTKNIATYLSVSYVTKLGGPTAHGVGGMGGMGGVRIRW
uniref:Autotransporter domain-containing protein n=1 Tax=Paraburkholderia sprentiae WSM5005 TaxID=754502 RepID=A0A1I9YN48_9BURK